MNATPDVTATDGLAGQVHGYVARLQRTPAHKRARVLVEADAGPVDLVARGLALLAFQVGGVTFDGETFTASPVEEPEG